MTSAGRTVDCDVVGGSGLAAGIEAASLNRRVVLLAGHGHHLGWVFTSGRFAGRHAAHAVVTDDLPEAADGDAIRTGQSEMSSP